jgi:hypothetical protein
MKTLFGSINYIKWLKESIVPLWTQGINLIMIDSLTKLGMICAIAGMWWRLTHQASCHYA